MPLKLNTASNGSVTLDAANTASNFTLTVPAQNGTVATTVDVGNFYGFKNRIINGDMGIDQRNAGASLTITTLNGQYTLDRWNVNTNQASKVSVQQSTTVPAGFKNSALITSLSAFSSGSGDYFGFVQYVEGFNAADFDWGTANAQTVTLSFRVRASITGTYSVAIGNSAGARSYVATFTVNSANTYETKTITIAGDTSGTWLTDSGRGLRMWFDLGSGSSFNQASANAWTASNTLRTSGSVSLVGTNGATFFLTGVQLEKGSVATSFDYLPYSTELQLCQRYCQRTSADASATYVRFGTGLVSFGGTGDVTFALKVTMRTTPSVTTTGTASNYAINTSSGTLNACNAVPSINTFGSNAEIISMQPTTAAGMTAGQACHLISNNNSVAQLTYTAEL